MSALSRIRELSTRRPAEPGECVTFAIEGRLPALNDYTRACRSGHQAGARMKREAEEFVGWHVTRARLPRFAEPVSVRFAWVEKDARRDPDNVAFGKKFILDVLSPPTPNNPRGLGVIPGDGQRHVIGLADTFGVDKVRPRIEVTIETRRSA